MQQFDGRPVKIRIEQCPTACRHNIASLAWNAIYLRNLLYVVKVQQRQRQETSTKRRTEESPDTLTACSMANASHKHFYEMLI